MEIHEALLSVGLLIVVAKLVEGIFKRFGLNSIIAYAVSGVILGPVTGLVEVDSEVEIILGIGIFLFFFLIGLDELDVRGFVAAVRGRLFVASVLSVLISLAVSLAVTTEAFFDLQLGLSFTQALGLAGVLSLSSLGVVAKALVDEGRLRHPVGVQMFTAVVIAEIAALFVVGFSISEHLPEGHAQQLDWQSVATVIAQIAGFAVVTWVVSTRVLPRVIELLHHLLQVPQLSFGLLLGGLFLVVVGAEEVGLHGSLGALLFGAALSTLPYQVRRDIMPGMRGTAEGFFVPLFFASAGLHLSLDFARLAPETIIGLSLVPLVGKFAGAFIAAYITRLRAPVATAAGLMAKGVAEIALLLVLFHSGAIDKGVFSLLVLVMFGYLLLTPLGISAAFRRVGEPESVADDGAGVPPSLDRFALEGIRVWDILDQSRTYPEQTLTVKAFAATWLVPEQFDYVVVRGDELAGIVSLALLRYLPRSEWEHTPLSRVLRRDTPYAYSHELVEDVLQRMTESGLNVFPVADRETGAFIGSISSHEIIELITFATPIHEV